MDRVETELGPERRVVSRLAEMADRLDNLAEVAELMDDADGASRFRAAGARCRDQAMSLLDEGSEPRG